MSAIRPFDWAQVRRMTGREVALLESVTARLAPKAGEGEFRQRIEALLVELLQAPSVLLGPEATLMSREEVQNLLPKLGTFAQLGIAPGSEKIIVDIDSVLSAFVIERLLGGGTDSAPAIRIAREPTEFEQGVLSYAVLRIMELVAPELHSGEETPLVLDAMVGRLDALEPVLAASEEFLQLGLRLQVGKILGYCRVLLPSSFVDTFFGARIADSAAPEGLLPLYRKRLLALPESHLPLTVVGAKFTLAREDLGHAEVRDIITLEAHQLTLDAEGAGGQVTLVPAQGRHGHLTATLGHADGEAQVTITALIEQQTQDGETMADAPEDNLPKTEGLLREMDASVAVEMGRIRLNTAQVIRLREGQVLKLSRSPKDPVDLVIRGKLFGKGELIEVDGELGVRLTHITGEH